MRAFLVFLSLLWTGINSFVTCRWRISYQTVGDSPWLLYNRQVSILSASAKSDDVLDATWFPLPFVYEDDIFNTEKQRELESSAVQLAAQLVRKRLVGEEPPSSLPIPDTVKGRFMDLACDHEGEMVLEDLFCDQLVVDVPLEVLQGAVMVLQSLAIMGLSVGLMGPPEQLRRMVAHLDSRNDPSLPQRDLRNWDGDSVRRLKHRLDRTPAIQLLAELHWKRTPQGAFDLLVGMGVWKKHEDLALLRSGFPLRFTMAELKVADKAAQSTHDPDALLGIRQDFRGMKVYTIDSASTSEIDDGVSLERIPREDGSQRHRIWVHIADADQWADEDLLEVARRRITSLYLPSGSFSMLPSRVSTEVMSLRANHDAFALSLGVELNDDGSVNVDSITMTPSLIRVNYRLTYDDVDEMLEEGSAYSEEWQLGALLDAAVKRRDYRIRNGSSEGFVPNPIPSATLSAFPDPKAPDGVAISHNVQVSHNAGKNQTSLAEGGSSDVSVPVSSAYLLVTESMILAGEAIGLWKTKMQEVEKVNGSAPKYPNRLELPFRTQPPPDLKSRSRERKVMMDLLEYNVGNGWCQAWYARRFLQPVKVSTTRSPHSGLGLSAYVQWTSPIRRFTDLLVHMAVKRYLRREKVYELIEAGENLPSSLSERDLGFPLLEIRDGKLSTDFLGVDDLDGDINYLEGLGLFGASRTLQRQSQQYWMFEHVRRLKGDNSDRSFSALVLGCVDPERQQYAIYLDELGLEHRFTSPGGGRLNPGDKLQLKVARVAPRSGILNFVLSN